MPSPLQKRSKEYKGLGGSASFEFWVWQEVSQKAKKLLAKVKENSEAQNYRTSMQSFVILGSLLQWRWQWASIGHFVFLFYTRTSCCFLRRWRLWNGFITLDLLLLLLPWVVIGEVGQSRRQRTFCQISNSTNPGQRGKVDQSELTTFNGPLVQWLTATFGWVNFF